LTAISHGGANLLRSAKHSAHLVELGGAPQCRRGSSKKDAAATATATAIDMRPVTGRSAALSRSARRAWACRRADCRPEVVPVRAEIRGLQKDPPPLWGPWRCDLLAVSDRPSALNQVGAVVALSGHASCRSAVPRSAHAWAQASPAKTGFRFTRTTSPPSKSFWQLIM